MQLKRLKSNPREKNKEDETQGKPFVSSSFYANFYLRVNLYVVFSKISYTRYIKIP